MDNPYATLEKRFKLRRTSGDHDAAGVHAKGSFHYRKAPWGGVEAYDYGDSVNTMVRIRLTGTFLMLLAKAGKSYRKRRIREVFGPFPFYVKDGRVCKGQFPGHADHVHVALSE